MRDSRELLITGASGFIGSALVSLALTSGWQVRTLCRRRQAYEENIQQFVGDICDVSLAQRACAGAAAVVHAAGLAHVFGARAKDVEQFEMINGAGTANVAKAARENNVSHLVLLSSVSVYGNGNGSVRDETRECSPETPYAVSKRQAEVSAINLFPSDYGALTILRLATVYGEGDRGNVSKLIRAIEQERFFWAGAGQNKKSLIYKRDAARACLLPLDIPARGVQIFNVSPGPASMREIVTAICQALDCPVPRRKLPLALVKSVAGLSRLVMDPWKLGEKIEKFVHEDVFDGTTFEREFSFSPSISLAEGMQREVAALQPKRRPGLPLSSQSDERRSLL
ncbi:MAG TPA: NAD-dependent epimerase/dehydratase family protein [Terracidiphilus sp.]|nr:NAD-dependent epimerase/dehydratase family protein [Terracidiphilus sp.]